MNAPADILKSKLSSISPVLSFLFPNLPSTSNNRVTKTNDSANPLPVFCLFVCLFICLFVYLFVYEEIACTTNKQTTKDFFVWCSMVFVLLCVFPAFGTLICLFGFFFLQHFLCPIFCVVV
eukprot:c10439_g1_i1.p1 GENE.c10439_g1_i1~~c10439_g1_i1.p1  ORF type:complete len:121 (+),score=15.67 c10439_g1_i1:327-689(+)